MRIIQAYLHSHALEVCVRIFNTSSHVFRICVDQHDGTCSTQLHTCARVLVTDPLYMRQSRFRVKYIIWVVLMTNEMHNSYNQFLFHSFFLSALHVSKESSRSSSEARHNMLYYTVQSVQSCRRVQQLAARLTRMIVPIVPNCVIQYIIAVLLMMND